MIRGERGLGAFLSDGTGFGKSGFAPTGSGKEGDNAISGEDPLPWLSLPALEFVEVAGQPQQLPVKDQLELLRRQMNLALQEGRLELATELRTQLEQTMLENGFEYISDDWQ